MAEYTFDCFTVVTARVVAKSEQEARTKLFETLDGLEMTIPFRSVTITCLSVPAISAEKMEASLVEIDGEAV